MTAFKIGQKVIVREFTGTVTNPAQEHDNACVEVKDDDGFNHYVFDNQVELLPPYEVGKMYASSNFDVFTFVKKADGKYGWNNPDSGFVFVYNYPTRPMRPVGEPVDED